MGTLTTRELWKSNEDPIIRVPDGEETKELISFLRSKRIGFVAEVSRDTPPLAYGGSQIVINNLNKFLRSVGIETVFFGTQTSTINAFERVSLTPSPVLKSGEYADKVLMDAADLLAMTWLEDYFTKGRLNLAHLHIPYNGPEEYLEVLGPTLATPHQTADGDWCWRDTVLKVSTAGGGVVFISKSQMGFYGDGLNNLGVVYNPVDVTRIGTKPTETPQEDWYLAFLGRCGPQKRPDLAARIAIESKVPLKMVLQCLTDDDWRYFHEHVEEHVFSQEGKGLIDCQIKEVGHAEKIKLFRGALATLFPITWEEPFGLVPIESLATGTPVITFDWGAIPELITSDVGCVVQVRERMMQTDNWGDIEKEAVREAAFAVRNKIPLIDRRKCREHVEDKFSLEVVGRRHLLVYAHLLGY